MCVIPSDEIVGDSVFGVASHSAHGGHHYPVFEAEFAHIEFVAPCDRGYFFGVVFLLVNAATGTHSAVN